MCVCVFIAMYDTLFVISATHPYFIKLLYRGKEEIYSEIELFIN